MRFTNLLFTIQNAKQRKEENSTHIWSLNSKSLRINWKVAILESSNNLRKHESLKNDLESIYDHIAEGIRIRSKCDWYWQGEKSTKLFLNLEKQQGNQNRIRKLILNEKMIIIIII